MLNLTIGFVVGLLSGLGLIGLYVAIRLHRVVKDHQDSQKKVRDKALKELERIKKETQAKKLAAENVNSRLEEAGKIMLKQNEIMTALQLPSASAIHSKYKNNLVLDWRELEQKKQAIFESILNDGFDPTLTVFDGDTKETKDITLSELMGALRGRDLPNDVPLGDSAPNRLKDHAQEGSTIKKKMGKNGKVFFLIERDKDETNH